jgi:radical SAM protein with 4Fe4S-binding SPASM domain
MTRRPIQDCAHPWTWLDIDARGNVKPCCHATKVLGNINQNNLEEVWNGEQMMRLRGAIHEGYVDPICRHAACTYVRDTEAAFGSDSYYFPTCELGKEYNLFRGEVGANFCAFGWADPEPWGVWTDGKTAVLNLDVQAVPSADLELKVLCFAVGTADHAPPSVVLEANGRQIDRWRFSHPENVGVLSWKTATVPVDAFNGSRLELYLHIEHPLCPLIWGGGDGRQLGIGVATLSLGPMPAHQAAQKPTGQAEPNPWAWIRKLKGSLVPERS